MGEMAKNQYEVGYKKPPTTTRFQKGRSGNPKGRPKKAVSREGFMEGALDKLVDLRDGDKVRRLTRRRAMVELWGREAAGGSLDAIEALLNLHKTGPKRAGQPSPIIQFLNKDGTVRKPQK